MITFTDIGLIVGGAVAGYILAKIVDYWNATRLMKKFKQEIDTENNHTHQQVDDADASFTKSEGKKRLNKPSPPQTQNENSTLSEMPVQVDTEKTEA